MERLLLVIVALLCATVAGGDFNTSKSIIILAGQSNMSGRGSLAEALPPECNPNPDILRFAANGTWEEARDPLHLDIDVIKAKWIGVGPGMPFSNAVLKKSPGFGVIGLVPCAIGDTSITQWAKGTPLYDAMVSRARAALLQGGGVIRALLWYQGENDCSEASAPLYKLRFKQFVNDLRADLDSPLLPIIEVALDVYGAYADTVRTAQFESAAELPSVKCVDARGLPLKETVHLTTASQVHLGGHMADAFLSLINQ